MDSTYDQHADYRRCHLGGFAYLVVEGFIWFLSAFLGAAGQIPMAMLVLLVGGVCIPPLGMAVSKLLKLPKPDERNRLHVLNTWMALTIPLGLPLIFMATAAGGNNLFYPAFAVVLGAHWLPFTYKYAMYTFLPLAVIMVFTGILFGYVFTGSFATCGFIVAGVLLVFAIIQSIVVRRELRN